MTFAGFPSRVRATAIPNVFFSDLLPRLAGDAAALGVVLYAFNALMRKKGYPRYLSAAELASEPALAEYLAASGSDDGAIEAGLGRATEIGVLLPLTVEIDGVATALYFLNAPADRRGMEAARSGSVDLGRAVRTPTPAAERSGVTALYELLIGTVSPLVSDELAEAERLYPAAWLEAAFREAAAQNARSWRYVTRILERWAAEGFDYAKVERDPAGDERYLTGKYGSVLRERLGG